MVRVNKTQFPKDLRDQSWEVLWNTARQAPSKEALKRDLGAFLTPTEIALLEKRIAIPILLTRGFSYREIGRTIDVSPTTVNFVKHHLTRKPRTPRRYSPLHTPHKKRNILLSPPSMGRGRWRWLDDLSR